MEVTHWTQKTKRQPAFLEDEGGSYDTIWTGGNILLKNYGMSDEFGEKESTRQQFLSN